MKSMKIEGDKMEISKSDWRLFREKLPQWQENYIDRLNREYIELLRADQAPSDKFWALDERIKTDRRKPGVVLSIRKSDVVFQLAALLHDEAICMEDLDDFSDELKESVKRILQY